MDFKKSLLVQLSRNLRSTCYTQGWKLLTVRLSGTGKNGGGQVKILGTVPKEKQNSITMYVVHRSQTGINSEGQVNILDTFPKERLNLFVISTPGYTVYWAHPERRVLVSGMRLARCEISANAKKPIEIETLERRFQSSKEPHPLCRETFSHLIYTDLRNDKIWIRIG